MTSTSRGLLSLRVTLLKWHLRTSSPSYLCPSTPKSSSSPTCMHSSLLCPSPHLLSTALKPTTPCREITLRLINRRRETSETWAEKTENADGEAVASAFGTSLLLHSGWMLAGDSGSGWTSGLRLGLREWKLLLPDSLVESEPEESELECLTRLPCVCARCADRLSVNTHTNIREGSEGVRRHIYCCYSQYLTHIYRHTEEKGKGSEGFVSRYLCLSQEADSWITCGTQNKHSNLLLYTLEKVSFKRRSQALFLSLWLSLSSHTLPHSLSVSSRILNIF